MQDPAEEAKDTPPVVGNGVASAPATPATPAQPADAAKTAETAETAETADAAAAQEPVIETIPRRRSSQQRSSTARRSNAIWSRAVSESIERAVSPMDGQDTDEETTDDSWLALSPDPYEYSADGNGARSSYVPDHANSPRGAKTPSRLRLPSLALEPFVSRDRDEWMMWGDRSPAGTPDSWERGSIGVFPPIPVDPVTGRLLDEDEAAAAAAAAAAEAENEDEDEDSPAPTLNVGNGNDIEKGDPAGEEDAEEEAEFKDAVEGQQDSPKLNTTDSREAILPLPSPIRRHKSSDTGNESQGSAAISDISDLSDARHGAEVGIAQTAVKHSISKSNSPTAVDVPSPSNTVSGAKSGKKGLSLREAVMAQQLQPEGDQLGDMRSGTRPRPSPKNSQDRPLSFVPLPRGPHGDTPQESIDVARGEEDDPVVEQAQPQRQQQQPQPPTSNSTGIPQVHISSASISSRRDRGPDQPIASSASQGGSYPDPEQAAALRTTALRIQHARAHSQQGQGVQFSQYGVHDQIRRPEAHQFARSSPSVNSALPPVTSRHASTARDAPPGAMIDHPSMAAHKRNASVPLTSLSTTTIWSDRAAVAPFEDAQDSKEASKEASKAEKKKFRASLLRPFSKQSGGDTAPRSRSAGLDSVPENDDFLNAPPSPPSPSPPPPQLPPPPPIPTAPRQPSNSPPKTKTAAEGPKKKRLSTIAGLFSRSATNLPFSKSRRQTSTLAPIKQNNQLQPGEQHMQPIYNLEQQQDGNSSQQSVQSANYTPAQLAELQRQQSIKLPFMSGALQSSTNNSSQMSTPTSQTQSPSVWRSPSALVGSSRQAARGPVTPVPQTPQGYGQQATNPQVRKPLEEASQTSSQQSISQLQSRHRKGQQSSDPNARDLSSSLEGRAGSPMDTRTTGMTLEQHYGPVDEQGRPLPPSLTAGRLQQDPRGGVPQQSQQQQQHPPHVATLMQNARRPPAPSDPVRYPAPAGHIASQSSQRMASHRSPSAEAGQAGEPEGGAEGILASRSGGRRAHAAQEVTPIDTSPDKAPQLPHLVLLQRTPTRDKIDWEKYVPRGISPPPAVPSLPSGAANQTGAADLTPPSSPPQMDKGEIIPNRVYSPIQPSASVRSTSQRQPQPAPLTPATSDTNKPLPSLPSPPLPSPLSRLTSVIKPSASVRVGGTERPLVNGHKRHGSESAASGRYKDQPPTSIAQLTAAAMAPSSAPAGKKGPSLADQSPIDAIAAATKAAAAADPDDVSRARSASKGSSVRGDNAAASSTAAAHAQAHGDSHKTVEDHNEGEVVMRMQAEESGEEIRIIVSTSPDEITSSPTLPSASPVKTTAPTAATDTDSPTAADPTAPNQKKGDERAPEEPSASAADPVVAKVLQPQPPPPPPPTEQQQQDQQPSRTPSKSQPGLEVSTAANGGLRRTDSVENEKNLVMTAEDGGEGEESDGEIVMHATSYPGMEWQPVFDME